MYNQPSIREVIAFPKSTSGVEDMSKAPITLEEKK
jgi:aspartyl-tRNA synthetase